MNLDKSDEARFSQTADAGRADAESLDEPQFQTDEYIADREAELALDDSSDDEREHRAHLPVRRELQQRCRRVATRHRLVSRRLLAPLVEAAHVVRRKGRSRAPRKARTTTARARSAPAASDGDGDPPDPGRHVSKSYLPEHRALAEWLIDKAFEIWADREQQKRSRD